MRLIWKKTFETSSRFTLMLPQNSTILSVSAQRDSPCIYFEFEDGLQAHVEPRDFAVTGTGQPFQAPADSRLKYLGTFQLFGGEFVGHLYEVCPY